MDSLVIGGFLPGTNTQLTFEAWLVAMAAILTVTMVIWLGYRYLSSASIDSFIFMRTIAPNATDLHLSNQA